MRSISRAMIGGIFPDEPFIYPRRVSIARDRTHGFRHDLPSISALGHIVMLQKHRLARTSSPRFWKRSIDLTPLGE